MDDTITVTRVRTKIVAARLDESEGWRVVVEKGDCRVVSVRFFASDAAMFRFVGDALANASDPKGFNRDR